ncbi:unnamed protein product [Bursaphelenchus okinawaensis]|uniref:Major facilitator superfamily (MFS) profile domain-containing protein n=1 Tax=Bursaphelenchus okinawaensis TaxID=465554 RepID=A0A811KDS7_9BILA|nr:unnamed protein product [Bursaphelenchus okinawaensis]CAG9098733.1 unnamed protein product [Bursaphelenchus okinawaensis]
MTSQDNLQVPRDSLATTATDIQDADIRLYPKRFLILGLFVLLSASNALQWIEYSIITEIVAHYWQVPYDWIDWTSMIYMLMYAILIFPGTWFLDRFGLRVSILIAAAGNGLGSWLKVLSVAPNGFWLTFLAQTIAGASQTFILGIPSHLAATWFGSNEVSTACAAGVFGNQLGIAIGFILPPWLIENGSREAVGRDLNVMFLISAVANTIIFLMIVFFFSDQPTTPPSISAHVRAQPSEEETGFLVDLKTLSNNYGFILLLISYGINVGVFYAISTLLSQMISVYHHNVGTETGTIGLLMVVGGMVGSVCCGYMLDRFHKYKLITGLVYLLSVIGMLLVTFTIQMPLWMTFFTATFLGFFMTGYLPVGFEYGAELTYPASEGTTSGLLNFFAQIFGIAMVIGMGQVIRRISVFWCNILLSIFLFIGMGLTVLIKGELKRHNTHMSQLENAAFDNSNFATEEANSTTRTDSRTQSTNFY